MELYDIAIIGGGLAGLTAALHLSNEGFKVLLIEKKSYPQHKVCGEYISNEIKPYFKRLGADLETIQPNVATRFLLSAQSGNYVEANLPLGGFGISRYTLDEFLYKKSIKNGVDFWLKTTVQTVDFDKDEFTIKCNHNKIARAKVAIGSFGKRSILDKNLKRSFFNQKTNYIGAKYYFKYDFPKDIVVLHNFKGGYCGAIQVENGEIDVAYLTTKEVVKEEGNLENFEKNILCKNPYLKDIFENGIKTLDRPMTISNVYFKQKELVKDHILMIGDAAGMIAPVSGNGMAMCVHGAKIASEVASDFLNKKSSRETMEKQYQKRWKGQFGNRLFWGQQLQKFMGHPSLSEFAVKTLKKIPMILPHIIKQTHGKVIR